MSKSSLPEYFDEYEDDDEVELVDAADCSKKWVTGLELNLEMSKF